MPYYDYYAALAYQTLVFKVIGWAIVACAVLSLIAPLVSDCIADKLRKRRNRRLIERKMKE